MTIGDVMRRFSGIRLPYFVLLLIVLVTVQISLNLLISRCDHDIVKRDARTEGEGDNARRVSVLQDEIRELRASQQALRSLLTKFKLEIATSENVTSYLRKQNNELQTQLKTLTLLRQQNNELHTQLQIHKKLNTFTSAQEFSKIKSTQLKKDFLKGDALNSEYELVPFDSFTTTRIYSVNKEGLSNRPMIRPLGTRYTEHHEVLRFSLKVLNNELADREKLTYNNLDHGITRLDRFNGMHYNLFFTGSKPNEYHRVKLRRPFTHLELIDNIETVDTSKEIINLILPLTERTHKFQQFLNHFAEVSVKWDTHVFLTVVYFGEKGRKDARKMLLDFERKENFTSYRFITEPGPFSRGVGLQRGVLSWDKGNNIMFFCDVDVHFTPDFLERCRLYTEPARMVYYPIVFSLYNPIVVYNGDPPSLEKQLFVGKENGFWRDFGFGMTCQYRNDFIATKGFDTTIQGWGMEDIKLFRKILRTDLTIIRAPDRGIFHLYHPKYCDPVLPAEQYLACLKSKAANEGSHRQMGMLAFGTKLFSNLPPEWKTRLLYQPKFTKRKASEDNEEVRVLRTKADELDIEVLDIQLLRQRLQTVMNFSSVDGGQESQFEIFNLNILDELESGLNKRADILKLLANSVKQEVGRRNETKSTKKHS